MQNGKKNKNNNIVKSVIDRVIEPEFECTICNKKFLHKSNLVIHQRIHTNLAFLCKYCGKRFARISNLKQHTRTHTKERPFLCDFCDKRFNQKHTLSFILNYSFMPKQYQSILLLLLLLNMTII